MLTTFVGFELVIAARMVMFTGAEVRDTLEDGTNEICPLATAVRV